MKLIVGLGNPGKEYENTRHNIGFMVIDYFCKKNDISDFKEKFNGLYSSTIINDEKIIILKPLNYINLSGEVVKKYVDFFKVDIDDILIINDDLDLPVGKFKLKQDGSSGGHNGLKNIELHLGTNKYQRLKIGISNNKQIDTKDYVLGHISNEELEVLNPIIYKANDIIMDYISLPFGDLMSKYNRK